MRARTLRTFDGKDRMIFKGSVQFRQEGGVHVHHGGARVEGEVARVRDGEAVEPRAVERVVPGVVAGRGLAGAVQ